MTGHLKFLVISFDVFSGKVKSSFEHKLISYFSSITKTKKKSQDFLWESENMK